MERNEIGKGSVVKGTDKRTGGKLVDGGVTGREGKGVVGYSRKKEGKSIKE